MDVEFGSMWNEGKWFQRIEGQIQGRLIIYSLFMKY